MNLERVVAEAFAARACPCEVVACEHPATVEYSDAMQFHNLDWRDTTCEFWSKFSDAIYGFSPEAFCYFLPGILCSQFKENRPDLLVNSSLIAMLDRSDNVEYWDPFFADRWPRLTPQECLAVQEWILWLSTKATGIYSEASLMRAYETLEILIGRATKGAGGK
jgi:hypothetical protein